MRKLIGVSIFLFGLMFSLVGSPCAKDNDQFDRFGGWKGLRGEKLGYFHTQEINGRWWLITPEGNVFWSTGMYCVRMSGIPEIPSERRPYKEACEKKYGSGDEWARITRLRLRQWGFNTVGDWSSPAIYGEPGFAYVIGIDLTQESENVIPEGSYGYFPDVFSEEFRQAIRKKMQKTFNDVPFVVDSPWLLGYFLADEPSWYGSKGKRGSLTEDYIALDESKPGKQAWVSFIREKYKEVKTLNIAWQTRFKSFDELLNIKEINNSDTFDKDKLEFLQIIAEEFSKVLRDTLREFDKNHLILGTRPSRLYPEVIKGIGKYSDVFGTTAHDFNPGYTIDPEYYQKIDTMHDLSGKPILLGVLISAQDSGLPYAHVQTQRDRGISYWRYLSKVAAHPAVIGLHWFQYFDPPLKCYDEKAANWGLVNQNDDPYEEATSLITQANQLVYAYALGITDFAPEFDSLFGTVKSPTPNATKKEAMKSVPIPLANAGFEQGQENWALQAWKGKSSTVIDASQKHSGRMSLRISGGPDPDWGSVGVGIQGKTTVTLKPRYQYKLSAWIKTKDVENSAFVRIKTRYTSGDEAYFVTEGAYGTKDWTKFETTFMPREENAIEYLAAQLVGKGTVWFDDITLEVIE